MRWIGPSTQQQLTQRHTAQYPALAPTQPPRDIQMNLVEEPEEAPPAQLSPEQQLVLAKVARGENVFFTGPAGESGDNRPPLISLKNSPSGTGKSVLIREIIRWAVRAGHVISVTASTGMAAVNIKGTTLHSWSGCGLCKKPASVYVKRIRKGESGTQRWTRTRILLVDES